MSTKAKKRSIAWCGCGNLSVDGLNFSRVEDAAVPTLECAACGAVSSDFEFVRLSDFKQRLLSEEALGDAQIAFGEAAPANFTPDLPLLRLAFDAALQAAEEGE